MSYLKLLWEESEMGVTPGTVPAGSQHCPPALLLFTTPSHFILTACLDLRMFQLRKTPPWMPASQPLLREVVPGTPLGVHYTRPMSLASPLGPGLGAVRGPDMPFSQGLTELEPALCSGPADTWVLTQPLAQFVAMAGAFPSPN